MQYASRLDMIKDVDPISRSTRGFLLWLQGLFATQNPGCFKWSSNKDDTEIIIADMESNLGHASSTRPRIVTQRSAVSVPQISTDITRGTNLSGTNRDLSFLFSTTMTFNCIAKEGLTAQTLAVYIVRMLFAFRRELQRLGVIHLISNNINILPETPHGGVFPGSSTPEWKLVRVIVPFHIQDQIQIDEDFHSILRDVTNYIDSNT